MVRLKLQRKPAMLRTASFALSLLCAAGAHAQVYKCVDPSGRITYSQIPCPAHTRSGAISRHSDRPASAPAPAEPPEKGAAAKSGASKDAGPKTPAGQEQAFRKRLQDREKAEKQSEQKAAETKRKEEDCRNARERLAQYETGGRIARTDAKGERYLLSDAQIAQETTRARADVADACK